VFGDNLTRRKHILKNSLQIGVNNYSFLKGGRMKKNTIQPLFDHVLIKPAKAEDTLPSGIILPDTAKDKPQMGEIMAVGPGSYDDKGKLIPMVVKVGQKVMYKKWGGDEVKVQGEEWMIVEQKGILAIVS